MKQKTNKNNLLYLLYKAVSVILIVVLMAVIFYLSAQVATDSKETSGFFITFIYNITGIKFTSEVIRTLAHFTEYTVLGFSFANCFYSFKNKAYRLLPIICSWAYAWSDEIHQIFVDGRAFQLSDLAVDLGGTTLGVFVFYLLIQLIIFIKNKRAKSGKTNR